MSDERIDKLPKWAQQEISRLKANIEWWKEKARQVEEGDTNVFLGDSRKDTALPPDSTVIFTLGERFDEAIAVDHDGHSDDAIMIRGRQGISIEPRASNSVIIRLLPR